MTATYGSSWHEVLVVRESHSTPFVSIKTGWFRLHYGSNEKYGEYLIVVTAKHSYLQCTKPQPVESTRAGRKPKWVYQIDRLPDDFYGVWNTPTSVSYGNTSVTFGQDHCYRNFITVVMPDRQLHLLIRDPDSNSLKAWSSHPAVAVTEGMQIHPAVKQLVPAKLAQLPFDSNTTYDAELDAMFAAI